MAPDPSATAARSGSPPLSYPSACSGVRVPQAGGAQRGAGTPAWLSGGIQSHGQLGSETISACLRIWHELGARLATGHAPQPSSTGPELPVCPPPASRRLLSLLDQGSGSRVRLHPPLGAKPALWGAEVAFFGRLAVQQLGCRMLLTLRALNKRQKFKKK